MILLFYPQVIAPAGFAEVWNHDSCWNAHREPDRGHTGLGNGTPQGAHAHVLDNSYYRTLHSFRG